MYWLIFLFSIICIALAISLIVVIFIKESEFDHFRNKAVFGGSLAIGFVVSCLILMKMVHYIGNPKENEGYWESHTTTREDYVIHQKIYCVDMSWVADRCSLVEETMIPITHTSVKGDPQIKKYETPDLSL